MKRQVVMNEKEFNELPQKLAEAIWNAAQNGYGYKFISRGTGEECQSFTEFVGFISIATGYVLTAKDEESNL